MKKNKLVSALLASCMVAGAIPMTVFADQYYRIEDKFPDPTVRELVSEFDLNDDGYLNYDEIERVTSFGAYDTTIYSLEGLEIFPLETLEINGASLGNVVISGFNSLKNLILNDCGITSVILNSDMPLENFVMCNNPSCTYIGLGNNTTNVPLSKLKHLVICNAAVSDINMSLVPNLKDVEIYMTPNLSAINMSSNGNFTQCYYNGISSYEVLEGGHEVIRLKTTPADAIPSFVFDAGITFTGLDICAEDEVALNAVSVSNRDLRSYLRAYDEDNDGILSVAEIGHITELDIDAQGGFIDLSFLKSFYSLNKLILRNYEEGAFIYVPATGITQFEYYGEAEVSNIFFNSTLLCHAMAEDGDSSYVNGTPYIRRTHFFDTEIYVFIPEYLQLIVGQVFDDHEKWFEINEVNFPDPVVRDFVRSVDESYYGDNDGYLCVYEALRTYCIDLSGEKITDTTGLELFHCVNSIYLSGCELDSIDFLWDFNTRHLKSLSISNNNFTELNLSVCSQLKSLYAEGCQLESIIFPENSQLEVVEIGDNNLQNVDLSGLDSLTDLYITNNQLTSLDLSDCENLVTLYCGHNPITEITFHPEVSIERLDCEYTDISKLDGLENWCSLFYLSVSHTNFAEINLENHEELECLDISGTGITNPDFSGCPNLLELFVNEYAGRTIDVSLLTNLTDFVAYDTNLTELDLSSNSNVFHLYVSGATGLVVDVTGCNLIVEAITEGVKSMYYDEIRYDYYGECLYAVEVDNTQTVFARTPADVITYIAPTDPVYNFATRLYTCALGREADIAGARYWYSVLCNSSTSAADVAETFLFSNEVMDSEISDEEFVNRLYLTFMGRECSPEEAEYWVNCLKAGAPFYDVFMGFVNSQEWSNLCYNAGIDSGSNVAPNVDREPSTRIISFVTDIYGACLGREPDEAGLAYWANNLANGRLTATEIITTFLASDEYLSRDISSAEYVTSVYYLTLDRDPGANEVEYWATLIDNGASPIDVLYGFCSAPEFAARCNYIGIKV